MQPRPIRQRFPTPWHVEQMPGGFRVIDANGTTLAYVYSLPANQRPGVNGITLEFNEARAIAKAIAGLGRPD